MTKRVRITIDLVVPSSIDGDAMEQMIEGVQSDMEYYRRYGDVTRIISADWSYITKEGLSP